MFENFRSMWNVDWPEWQLNKPLANLVIRSVTNTQFSSQVQLFSFFLKLMFVIVFCEQLFTNAKKIPK